MSDVCDSLLCSDSEVRTSSLFLESLAYWIPEDIKQPVINAVLYTEGILLNEDGEPILSEDGSLIYTDNLYDCNKEIRLNSLLRMVFTSDKKVRVVLAGEIYESLDENCNEYRLNSLLRMAFTKTVDGCTAIRVKLLSQDSLINCNELPDTRQRIRTSFFINSSKTETAIGVFLNEIVGEDFINCADFGNGISVYEMLSRLFIIKTSENNYIPSISY